MANPLPNPPASDSPAAETPAEPWGWNRPQRIALGLLLLLFLLFLLIQFARRPARLDDPVVTYNGQLVTLPARIDPNIATLQELSRIPHLGESLAAKILQYRDSHKATTPDGIVFRQPADLDPIPGIGKKLIDQLAPFLAFPDDTPGTAPAQ